MKIINLIDKLIAKEDAMLNKPSSDGFELIYDELYSRDDYRMVGDSDHNREAAKSARIDFVRVKFTFDK